MLRAAGYSRVSTNRQAIEGISIDDQLAQIEAYCVREALAFTRHYTDRGLSGSDEDRPELQRMVADALTKPRLFDRIVVHSASRLFRDAAIMELTIRRLRRAGVEVIFITQPTTHDSTGDMVRQILGIMDEHTAKETAKHVKRSMIANAKAGFWNGATPPFGYRSFIAEVRGKKQKKKLEIDPVESRIVDKMFALAETGEGQSGPFGVKNIVNWLHAKGYRTRTGHAWHVQTVYSILTGTIYKGIHWFNTTDSKTREPRPVEEHVSVEMPAIIETGRWERVQEILRSKNPKVASPKVITGPILLTGLVRCERCGFAMTLRTGGSGAYRYYTCAGAQSRGPAVCEGVSIPMDRLDLAVTDSVVEKLLQPVRLRELFTEVLAREQRNTSGSELELLRVERELADARQRIDRLLNSVETGLFDANDDDLRTRLDAAKQDRAIATEAKMRIEARMRRATDVSPAKLVAFADFLSEALRCGEVPFRKAYLRMLIDWIDVTKHGARIRVRRSALRDQIDRTDEVTGKVPISIQEWRTRHDSNV
jgi:site-specific DNA recombinase